MDEYEISLERIRGAKRFLICSHLNPDGDGIGSTIAMGLMLSKLGKSAVMYNRDPLPSNLGFLPLAGEIVRQVDWKQKFDMTIMVDCAQRKRISDEFAAFKGCGEVLCIDHHLLETPESDLKLIDSSAAATGEVVFRFFKRAGLSVDAKFAQCIYTTLVVDTGFFKYSSTTADILRLAAELVAAGASPWVVAKNLEESYPSSRMKLLGFSLSSVDVRQGGKYAVMEVTQQMLANSGARMDQSDEFAVYPRSIEGVEVAALFREMNDGHVKVSLRSKDRVDVAAIARIFGGGGHARAAGCRIKDTMSAAKEKIEKAVLKAPVT